MKRLLKPMALLVCLATVVACKKSPIVVEVDPVIVNALADYQVIPDPTDAFSFEFKNLSTNYKTLEWRFGDDTLTSVVNPKHTYLTTGKYTVDLKAFSATGAQSRKLVDLNIIPDSVVKVVAEKTANLNEIKFSVNVKATVASILWTWTDGQANSTSTLLSPVRKLIPGSFKSFSVKVVTNKGSVVTVSRYITTEGIAENITAGRIATSVTVDNTSNGNENAGKLLDNNTETKFGYYSGLPLPFSYVVQFPGPVAVKLYGLGNGNDSGTGRDPKGWNIEASNDGINWDIIDTRLLAKGFYDQLADQGLPEAQRYKTMFYYPIATPKPYSYYKWKITSLFGTNFQMSELQFFR